MYEPTDATFAVDFATAVLTVLAYMLILAVIVKVRAPAARSLKDASETLTRLARSIDPGRAATVLTVGALVLTALGSLVAYSDSEALHIFIFRLNDERTIPTFYNSLQLLTAATIALLIAREQQRSMRLAWSFFALGFIAAGIDESADMHARFEYRTGLNEEIALLPIIILLLIALVILWRPLIESRALPLLISGGILIVASQGFDLNHAKWSQRIAEEALELVGCMLFVLAMLLAIRSPKPLDRTVELRYSRTG